MSEFPDTSSKKRGDYVRTVHPLNVGRYPDGIVSSVDPICDCGADFCGESPERQQITVHIGVGSTVYGPARNWKVIEETPAWLAQLEGDGDAA